MKIKKDFTLRQIGDEYIVVAHGEKNIDFNRLISFNSTSAYLFERLSEMDFVAEDAARLLMDRYDVDENTALKDSKVLIEKWLEAGLLEV